LVCCELPPGGAGAPPTCDGEDALVSCFNTANIPVEIHEATAPVLVERFELLADSGGPGLHRGGVGIRKAIRLLAGPVRLTNLSDRFTIPPWGLAGGDPGECGSVSLLRDGGEAQLHSKETCDLEEGDVLDYRVSGAGGWGNPFERDPAAVLEDVIDGLVSPEAAREQYGVVVNGRSVDEQATRELREARA